MAIKKVYRKFRRYKKKYTKNYNVKKMMGHVVNRGLSYASRVPGPIGSVARAVSMIKGLVNVEVKYLDTTVSAAAITNSVSSFSQALNSIIEGDEYNNRNGRSILNRSISVNWSCIMHASATNTYVRLVLACDKKPDVGTVNYGSVYGSSSNYLTQINKAEDGDRFVILKDILIKLSTAECTNQYGKIYVDLKGTHTIFDASSADTEKNRYFIVAISDQPTNTPTLNFVSRFRFTDN